MGNIGLNIALYSPEIILCLTLCFVLIIQMVSKNEWLTLLTALIGCGVAAIDVITLYSYEPQFYFSNHLSHDPFSLFFKLFFIVVTFFTFLFAYRSYDVERSQLSEFYLLVLAVTVGMSTLVSSLSLLTLYLSLEMVSIVSYTLVGFRRRDRFSNEAAIKYLLYGAMASGVLLWGLSLLYGLAGSLNIYSIHASLTSIYTDPLSLYLILLLILVGFGFKMVFVPFHMWAPDVYQGAPTPVAAFLTVAPKAAGFALFARVFYTVFASQAGSPSEWVHLANLNWPLIIAILSAVTMTVGNLSALFQKNTKRMLAYSSIAHAGYMMMGLIVLSKQGLTAILFYVVVYFLMNFGAFFVVGLVANTFKGESIEHFKGLGWKSPFIAVAMTIFLLSLTGVPPFAGFIGKIYLFWSMVHAEIYWLLIVAVINVVISLYYYAYIMRKMFLEKPDNDTKVELAPFQQVALSLLVIPTVVLGVYWEPLFRFVERSLQFIVVP